MPKQYKNIRVGALSKEPEALIRDRVMDHMREYAWATGVRKTIID
jgi:tagatose-1,6-bisphosphate aldolase non-catalytic subunit AgaZ/GatZ